MRVVLLGANGQLGSDIIRANASRPRAVDLDAVTRASIDVLEPESIEKGLADRTFDALINCTSFHKTDEVEGQGATAVAVNATAPRLLAEICAARGARFVHISTDYVFGGYTPDRPLNEGAPPAPVNVYGATKLLGESLASRRHADTLILRVASLFGVAGASGKGGNFVETMIRLATERGQLRVVDDQVMSPTATADVANWILTLLENEAPPGRYHAVNSGSASWCDFARKIVEMCKIDAEVTPVPTGEMPTVAMRPPYSALDNSKLEAAVGPVRPWESALADYLRAKGRLS